MDNLEHEFILSDFRRDWIIWIHSGEDAKFPYRIGLLENFDAVIRYYPPSQDITQIETSTSTFISPPQ